MAGWGGYAKSNGKANNGYVEEGNAKCYMFSEEPTRVRFLTEDISVEQVMSDKKITREEAEDFVYTKLSQDRWVMPKSYWEHSIKEIPGKRFFSTATCLGRNRCQLCVENDIAKNNGITENKLLPFPVRKRFIVPAYFYDLGLVLMVRGNEEFFDGIANYIAKNGVNCDFDIYKKGKGFNTTYHAIFDGISKDALPEGLVIQSPRELDTFCGHDELTRRVEGGKPKDAPYQKKEEIPETGAKEPGEKQTESEGEFKLPFGTHKGLTFDQLQKAGNGDYIKFLAENSAGEVQKKAKEFLGIA